MGNEGKASEERRYQPEKGQDDGRKSVEQKLNILVVDDEPDILFATARILHSAGHRVEEAETGEQCLRMITESPPDLVLLDVMLPDRSGYEVCRQIKGNSKSSGIYVMLLSGKKTTADDQSEGLEIGADGYLARPVAKRELLARVEAMARIIRAERDRDRLIEELQAALDSIKILRGLLPICANCKKIRNDKGYWEGVETYVTNHSEATFSHGICPECVRKLYPEFADEIDESRETPVESMGTGVKTGCL